MPKTTHTEDLPLTDPRHPLHAANAPKPVEEGKPVATEVVSDRKVPDTSATMKANAKPTKAERKTAKARKAKEAEAHEAAVEEGAAEPKLPRSVVPPRYKTLYAATDNTCGDVLATAFKKYTTGKNADGREALDMSKLEEVAKANDVPMIGKNNGLIRMNVGNRLRGLLKHGKTVVIGKQRFAGKGKESAALQKPEPVQAAA